MILATQARPIIGVQNFYFHYRFGFSTGVCEGVGA